LALVNVEVHAPVVVVQEPTTWPPSVTKVTAVPSGTGLLKWSDRRIVKIVEAPLIAHPSILSFDADNVALS